MTKSICFKFRKNIKPKKKLAKNNFSYLFYPKNNLISEINFLRNYMVYIEEDTTIKNKIKLAKKKQLSFLSKISTKKTKLNFGEILFYFLKIGTKKFLSFFLIKTVPKYCIPFLLWIFIISFNYNQPKNIKDSEQVLIANKLNNKNFFCQKEFLRLKIYFFKKLHYTIKISSITINKMKKERKDWKNFILFRILCKIIYPSKENNQILKKTLLQGIITKESWCFLNLGFLNLKILTIFKNENAYGTDFGKFIYFLIPFFRYIKSTCYHFWWKNILLFRLMSPTLFLNRNVLFLRKRILKKWKKEKNLGLTHNNFSQNKLLNFFSGSFFFQIL
jgi:hypothetical protein